MPSLLQVSAGESGLATDQSTIEATTGLANITATFVDAAGNPLVGATEVSLASTGTGNTITAVSTQTSAAGVYRWTFASTVAEAKTLTATAPGLNVTQTVAVTVSGEAPSAPVLVANSRWQNATGTTAAAINDGGIWDGTTGGTGNNGGVETLASLALTEPAELSTVDNALVVRSNGADSWVTAFMTAEYVAGNPTNGEVRYFRHYDACLIRDAITPTGAVGNVEHGYESADTGGGDGWNLMRIPRTDGTYFLGFRDITSGFRWMATGISLAKEAFNRLELRLAYGETTYTVQLRIYDETGALVADASDFVQTLPNDPSITLDEATIAYTAANHANIRIGSNGPSSNYPASGVIDTDPMFATTAWAYSTTDWCGPYVSGNG